MLPLRYPWVWWALGLLLVGGVVFGSLSQGLSRPPFGMDDKLLHAFSYFVLMLWYSGLYRRTRHLPVAMALFVLGLTLDYAQGFLPRRVFDLNDVAANAGGILAGLILSRFALEGWCQRAERFILSR